jgi:hypothetical protein
MEAKAKEAKKREEQFLEETYTQRLSEMSEEDQDDWDPVQDVFGYERDNYVDIIKFFLMIKDQDILLTLLQQLVQQLNPIHPTSYCPRVRRRGRRKLRPMKRNWLALPSWTLMEKRPNPSRWRLKYK